MVLPNTITREHEASGVRPRRTDSGAAREGCAQSKHAAPTLQPGTLLDRRYRILSILGCGGEGRVYAAMDRCSLDVVAIKAPHDRSPLGRTRLAAEFCALSSVRHASLVRVQDLHDRAPLPYFTMERLYGSELGAHLRHTDRSLCLQRMRSAFGQLARGLHALHRHNLLHLDLKPSNVLVDRCGHLRLVDLGIAQRPGEVRECHRGLFRGTPQYAAPEQLTGRALHRASDWYSFGILLYEALTGALPFRGDMRQLAAAKQAGLQVRTNVPDAPDLLRLCHALLRPRPRDRADASEVFRVLTLAASPHPGPAGGGWLSDRLGGCRGGW